jgi:hypothetical protein
MSLRTQARKGIILMKSPEYRSLSTNPVAGIAATLVASEFHIANYTIVPQRHYGCVSACKFDPVFGVIGIQY